MTRPTAKTFLKLLLVKQKRGWPAKITDINKSIKKTMFLVLISFLSLFQVLVKYFLSHVTICKLFDSFIYLIFLPKTSTRSRGFFINIVLRSKFSLIILFRAREWSRIFGFLLQISTRILKVFSINQLSVFFYKSLLKILEFIYLCSSYIYSYAC